MDDELQRRIGLLRQSAMFTPLDAATLSDVASRLTSVELAENDVLFRQGEAGDALYLLERGELAVRVAHGVGDESVVDRLGAGAVVGEMALVTDEPRNATVAAATPASLWRLARPAFDQVAATHAALLERAHEAMRPRLERAQLAELLADWFGATGSDAVLELQQRVTWTTVARGEALYRQGDEADRVYLVVSGQFVVTRDGGEGGPDLVQRVGRGESLGGRALLVGGPREATAVAQRDSHVVGVPLELAEATPTFVRRLARGAVLRSEGTAHARGGTAATLVLLPLDAEAPAEALARELASRMDAWGGATLLTAAGADARFGRDGAAQCARGEPFDLALSTWWDQQERHHRHVVALAEPAATPWTLRCLRGADLVVLVGRAGAGAEPGELERALAPRLGDVPVELALVHPDDAARPSGTLPWLEARAVRAHHHLRLGVEADVARVARRLAGRGLGLALSGGGARGYVHIGLLRAAAEAGLTLDIVAGSSMGALVGGVYALSGGFEPCIEAAASFGDRRKVIDYTLPLVALTRSRKLTALLQALFGEAHIEDLWIPYTCVSASLTRSHPRLHDRGPLWRAVRASVAIPGIFTPVLMDGEVLVDGGVMNNFPVDVLRDRLPTGPILASNAYGAAERARPMRFGDDISGWSALASKVLPWARGRLRAPSILGTLMRATSLSSHYQMDDTGRYADLVVRYPTEGTSSLEFDRYRELIDLGYARAREALDGWAPWPAEAAATGP